MTTINNLSAVSTVSPGDQFPIFSTANGDARRVAFSVLAEEVLQSDQRTVTGSTGGNVALQNLLAALAAQGLIVNSTT
jgi:hypothetical protein